MFLDLKYTEIQIHICKFNKKNKQYFKLILIKLLNTCYFVILKKLFKKNVLYVHLTNTNILLRVSLNDLKMKTKNSFENLLIIRTNAK